MRTATKPAASTVASKTFTFSSAPRPLDGRPRYREGGKGGGTLEGTGVASPSAAAGANIMYDYRVRRESLMPLLRGTEKLSLPSLATIAARRSLMATNPSPGATACSPAQLQQAQGPAPVSGRQHADVQTESFLEELAEKPREATQETQTDAFMDRPPSPLFVPAKTGEDVETQVEAGELFDFDREVEPLLEVIVGKCLDQALTELVEEEELEGLRKREREFEVKKGAELAEVQRLEEEERRKVEERERRLAQERKKKEEREKAVREVAIRETAKQYVTDLTKCVFSELRRDGLFKDKVREEIQSQFMPWLAQAVGGALDQRQLSKAVLQMLVSAALQKSAAQFPSQQQPSN